MRRPDSRGACCPRVKSASSDCFRTISWFDLNRLERSARGLAAAAGLVLSLLPADAAGGGPGGSLVAELFPGGLPVPFEAVVERLRREAGAGYVQTALVPLGRSLQRYAADPDYFSSPRVVVAVTGDRAAGPDAPRLADRLFLGYQPAADVIEAISYDEAAGRFVFEEVVGYATLGGAVQPAEARVCVPCHQGERPIFSRPLWSETNANPEVVARLAGLGERFEGVPVRQTVDGLAALDAATDRAAEVEAANRLWRDGCGDAACRAALLAAAVTVALGGAPDGVPAPAGFEGRAAALWPDGLAIVSPDLPNRDPLAQADPADLETVGELNPETPRAPRVVWEPRQGFAEAARLVAGQFTAGDRAWIADRVAGRGSVEALALACEAAAGRFDCAGPGVAVAGLVGTDGAPRLRRLAIDGLPPIGRLAGDRLPDGRRVSLVLGGDAATLTLGDDLAPLDAALADRAAGADPALGDGPFRRRAVLAMLADCLEARNG